MSFFLYLFKSLFLPLVFRNFTMMCFCVIFLCVFIPFGVVEFLASKKFTAVTSSNITFSKIFLFYLSDSNYLNFRNVNLLSGSLIYFIYFSLSTPLSRYFLVFFTVLNLLLKLSMVSSLQLFFIISIFIFVIITIPSEILTLVI